jgi:hypothetical protein
MEYEMTDDKWMLRYNRARIAQRELHMSACAFCLSQE